jgi:hypothetical protein
VTGGEVDTIHSQFPIRANKYTSILTIALLAFCRYILRVMNDGRLLCSVAHKFDIRLAGASLADPKPRLDPLSSKGQDGIIKAAWARPAGATI